MSGPLDDEQLAGRLTPNTADDVDERQAAFVARRFNVFADRRRVVANPCTAQGVLMDEFLSEAIRLSKHGGVLPVFGVRRRSVASPYRCACGEVACGSPGKHPVGNLVPRGLNDATRELALIERWWPGPHNIAFATGSVIAVDIDDRHEGEKALADLETKYGQLPSTWRSLTGNGQHILFKAPPGRRILNSAGKLGRGIDIRGVGGFIVAPPSQHASGRTYCWSVDHHPDEVLLAPMPAWMVDACAAPLAAAATFDVNGFLGVRIPEGGRNATLTSLAGHLLRRYVDPLLVFELVAAFNDVRCCPPLTHADVRKLVNSVAGRELRRRCAA